MINTIEEIRADTPSCSEVLFLSSAGSSLMPDPVLRAQVEFLALEAKVGGYRAFQLEQRRIENCYLAISQIVAELTKRDIMVTTSDGFGARIDTVRRNLPSMVRDSPHYFNTGAELCRFANEVADIVGRR